MKKLSWIAAAFCFSFLSSPSYAETQVSAPLQESEPADQSGAAVLETAEELSLIDHRGSIYHIDGSSQIMKKSSGVWAPALVGMAVEEGDQIKTGPESITEIYYDQYYLNNTRIESNTLAEFKSIEPTQVALMDGTLFSLMDGLPVGTGYEVVTPTAVASIRGTGFAVTHNALQKTNQTAVVEGEVRIFPFVGPGAIDPAKHFSVPAEQVLMLDHKILPQQAWDQIKPQLMDEEQKLPLEASMQEARVDLIMALGNTKVFNQGLRKWLALRLNDEKMDLIRTEINTHGQGKMLTSGIASEEDAGEEDFGDFMNGEEAKVITSQAVVGNAQDQKLQDSLIGAAEAVTGDSDAR